MSHDFQSGLRSFSDLSAKRGLQFSADKTVIQNLSMPAGSIERVRGVFTPTSISDERTTWISYFDQPMASKAPYVCLLARQTRSSK